MRGKPGPQANGRRELRGSGRQGRRSGSQMVFGIWNVSLGSYLACRLAFRVARLKALESTHV